MSENEKIKQESPDDLKDKQGARAEEFIISNSNGNGINPNPTEDGNSPEWDKGIEENNDYKADAQNTNLKESSVADAEENSISKEEQAKQEKDEFTSRSYSENSERDKYDQLDEDDPTNLN